MLESSDVALMVASRGTGAGARSLDLRSCTTSERDGEREDDSTHFVLKFAQDFVEDLVPSCKDAGKVP